MRYSHLLCGAAAAALLTTAAVAQEAAAPAADEQVTDTAYGDIVVTAQKREQNLQDVSASVSAVSSERLMDARINSVEDLQTIVPTVTFGQDFNIAKIFIRGVGQNTSTAGSEPAVSFHVDGAVVARPEAQLTALFDLERIEVLRGPQGTLYGRNSTGGSINLITAKPTRDFSGYANISYGNYNLFQVEGAVSGPITDSIRARLAFRTENRDGFGRNNVTGSDVDDADRYMARGHLEFDLGETVNLLLTGEYYHQDDHSGAIHFRRQSFPGVPRLASLGIGGYAARPRDLDSEIETGTNTETWAVTGTLGAEVSDDVSLTNVINYRDFDTYVQQDLDVSSVIESLATNGAGVTIQRRFTRSKQFSNEFRVNYATPYVNAVGGLFYFNEQQDPADTLGVFPLRGEQSFLSLFPTAGGITLAQANALCQQTDIVRRASGPVPPGRVCVDTHLGTAAYAAFGQMVIGLGAVSPSLESLSIKLGGRYSHEKRDSENPALIIAANGRGPVNPPVANPATPIGAIADTYRERTFSDFTPEVGAEWHANDDLLIYYTYSEGFKAGSGENSANSITIVDPETIKNHEAGIKATLLDRRLLVNLSAYSYKLRDLQINKTIAGGPAGFQTIFQNAARTKAKGFELEVIGRPLDTLRVGGALAYTDAKYVDFVTVDPLDPRNILTPGGQYNPAAPDPTAYGAPCTDVGDLDPATPTCEINLAGNRTRNTPKWVWNLNGEWDLPVPDTFGRLTLSGDISYKGKTYFTEFQRLLEGSTDYTMVNAALLYKARGDRISASLWVKNLTDVFRPSSTFALATGRIVGVTYLPPRTYGATVGYRF